MKPGCLVFVLAVGAVLAVLASAQQALPQFTVPAEVRKAIDLPNATEGTVPWPEGRFVVEAAIHPRNGSGLIYVDGKGRGLAEAKEILFKFSYLDRDPDDSAAPSEVPVVLLADASERWRHVQWFLQVCGDPDVRIHRIHIAVRTGDKTAVVPVFLPSERAVSPGPGGAPALPLRLKRVRGESETRFTVDEQEMGAGDAGFVEWKKAMTALLKEDPARPLEVNGWPEVPLTDVVRVVAALRAAGAENIYFRGTAMPGAPPPERDWRMPDSIRSKMDLPVARTGLSTATWRVPVLELAIVGPDRMPYAKGRGMDLDALRNLMKEVCDSRRDRRGTPALSTVFVRILADRSVPWKEVRYLLHVCADPEVLANRVHFAVRDGEEERVLPVWLPSKDPTEGVAWLKVDLEAAAGEETTVKLRGEALGTGEKGLAALAAALRFVREKYPDRVIHAEVAPAGEVPYGDVVTAVDALRAIDIPEIRFLDP